MYTIHPLHLGTFTSMEMSNLLYQTNPGQKVRQPILGWLLKSNTEAIVVDTGGSDEVWAETYHHGLERPEELTIQNQLKKYGVDVRDVEIVINTHLHWDHCFQNDAFHNAKILVQRKELQSAVAPIPTQRGYYETGIPGVQPSWMKTFDRMEVVDGDIQLGPGLQLVHLPGHTPGLQGVLVETQEGPYLIASDTIGVYENWTGTAVLKHVPQGIHWNLESYFETFAKMERLGAQVLPCHDMRVLERDCYGA
jgi:N-acyl homoserine lactone hydrolase